ncbi:hypothetical protein [Methylobacterium pseudosasicola]|uniref:Uncharacterized protein n=1 Tax=Methylobacterium pseudosasicola TaxID=582667 RepID=A0A1I4QN44_9HYPH|nr:hypothetical protein [Methylobacterium pseudosasicola]SFM41083.1 hypothetical protein SAMN05192568_103059 [Methylobacterium pseudosasicola]
MTRRLTDEAFLNALDDLIVEDILDMTGDELRAEIVSEGGDPDAIEAECRAALERAIREAEGRTPIAWSLDPVSPRVEIEEAPAASSLPAVGSFW